MTNSLNRGTVQIQGDTVTFDQVVINDAVIAAEFKSALEQGVDLIEYTHSLLDIAARTAALRSNTAGAEKIEASLKSAKEGIKETAKNLEETIKKQVTDLASEDGQLLKGIEILIERYQDEIEELANGEDSELRKVMLKMLREAKDEISKDVKGTVASQEQKLGQLLDPQNPLSPLRQLATKVDEVAKSLAELREQEKVETAVAEVIETGVFGGVEYEEVAVQHLQRIAAAAQDDCEATGSVTGRVARSKMGDAVIDLKVGGKVYARMVMEAKNKALSKSDWEKEAKGSKENRAASGFIGMCKHLADMPNGSRLMILDAQSIVLAYNPDIDDPQLLALVYQVVKMNTLNNAGGFDGIDMVEVNVSLQEALKALERFDALGKQVSAIENAAKAIRKEAGEIRDAVETKIGQVQRAIATELEPAALEASSIESAELESPKELES